MTESYGSPPAARSYAGAQGTSRAPNPATLADILERVLDKGIIIAGDIRVNLLDIELLTIKIRLLVASVDKAEEMGIDWWRNDPLLSSGEQGLADENRRLRERIEALEAREQGGGELPAGGSDRSAASEASEASDASEASERSEEGARRG